jgi:hypothetical protein
VSGVTSRHHVFGIKHLLSKFWNGESTVLLASSSREWGEPRHEEVKAGEWNHVDSELPQISIQLTWKSETRGNARHCERDEMIEVSVGGVGELEGTEANVVEGLVVNAVGLVSVFYELVDGECGVVGLNDRV